MNKSILTKSTQLISHSYYTNSQLALATVSVVTVSNCSKNLTNRYNNILISNRNVFDNVKYQQRNYQVIGKQGKLREALQIYKQLYNSTEIYSEFLVPTETQWPKEFHGFNLGKRLETIKLKKKLAQMANKVVQQTGSNDRTEVDIVDTFTVYQKDEEAILNKMNLENKHSFEDLYEALLVYKSIYGTCYVPQHYVIPEDSRFPEALWGMKLGYKTQHIRLHNYYAAYHDELRKIGFPFETESRDFIEWDGLYTALKIYKKIYNHWRIPWEFVIPSDKRWPQNLWGLHLGSRRAHIIYREDFIKNHPDRRKLLEDIDFPLRKKQ